MRKTILALSVAAASAAPSLCFADTILGLYAGVGQWQASLSGEVGDKTAPTSVDDLNFKDKDGTVIWAKLEHPVPFIPNVMLKSTSLSTTSSNTFSEVINLGGDDITGQIHTDLDLSHIDATLYYEILDNWVTLDVGLTGKVFSGHFDVNGDGDIEELNDISGTIPMLYLSGQFDLPLTGVHAGVNINTISAGDDKITDTSVYLGYMGDIFPMIDLGVNLGYRDLSIALEDEGDIYVDTGFDGVFFELIAHF